MRSTRPSARNTANNACGPPVDEPIARQSTLPGRTVLGRSVTSPGYSLFGDGATFEPGAPAEPGGKPRLRRATKPQLFTFSTRSRLKSCAVLMPVVVVGLER